MMRKFEFRYESKVNCEEVFLEDLAGICSETGMDGTLKNRVMLVLSELFNNAVIHGNRLNSKKIVKVIILVNSDELIADIIDEGVNGLEEIKKRKPSEWYSEGGRGIDLVEHYSDSIDYCQLANSGLRVTVGFKLHKQTSVP